MPAPSLPPGVEAVLRHVFTCEFTTVNRQGQPMTWPSVPYYDPTTGRITCAVSIAFPVKAYNARRHPQVSLLFSDPTGSGLDAPPAVLVQGDAAVAEVVEYPRDIIGLFRTVATRQPDSSRFTNNRVVRRLFAWYLFQRISLTVTPRRLLVWPGGDFGREPQAIELRARDGARSGTALTTGTAASAPAVTAAPPPAWDPRLAAQARDFATGVLSWVEASGDPVSVRVAATIDDGRRRVTFPGMPPIARASRGPACLLFHRHDERLEGLRQQVLRGCLVDDDEGGVALEVDAFVTANGRTGTDQMPHAGAPLHMLQFYRLGRRKANEYLARRGEPWPAIPYAEIARQVRAFRD